VVERTTLVSFETHRPGQPGEILGFCCASWEGATVLVVAFLLVLGLAIGNLKVLRVECWARGRPVCKRKENKSAAASCTFSAQHRRLKSLCKREGKVQICTVDGLECTVSLH
jgi:hypothetical protein